LSDGAVRVLVETNELALAAGYWCRRRSDGHEFIWTQLTRMVYTSYAAVVYSSDGCITHCTLRHWSVTSVALMV